MDLEIYLPMLILFNRFGIKGNYLKLQSWWVKTDCCKVSMVSSSFCNFFVLFFLSVCLPLSLFLCLCLSLRRGQSHRQARLRSQLGTSLHTSMSQREMWVMGWKGKMTQGNETESRREEWRQNRQTERRTSHDSNAVTACQVRAHVNIWRLPPI